MPLPTWDVPLQQIIGSGSPGSTLKDGQIYFDTTGPTLWVGYSGANHQLPTGGMATTLYNTIDGVQFSGSGGGGGVWSTLAWTQGSFYCDSGTPGMVNIAASSMTFSGLTAPAWCYVYYNQSIGMYVETTVPTINADGRSVKSAAGSQGTVNDRLLGFIYSRSGTTINEFTHFRPSDRWDIVAGAWGVVSTSTPGAWTPAISAQRPICVTELRIRYTVTSGAGPVIGALGNSLTVSSGSATLDPCYFEGSVGGLIAGDTFLPITDPLTVTVNATLGTASGTMTVLVTGFRGRGA